MAPNFREMLAEIEELEMTFKATCQTVEPSSEKLIQACRSVDDAFSGSWFGWHHEMYYGDFEKPALNKRFSIEWGAVHGLPNGWNARRVEEVRKEIERRAGVTYEDVENQVKPCIESAKKLQQSLGMELLSLVTRHNLTVEAELLKRIESLDFENEAHNRFCSAQYNSAPNMTRDSGAVSQGFRLPAHVYFEGQARQFDAHCRNSKKLVLEATKLIRLIETARTAGPVPVLAGATMSRSASEVASHIAPHDEPHLLLQDQFRRFRIVTFSIAAVSISVLFAIGCEFLLRQHSWHWLVSHRNSYSIRGMFYSFMFCVILGTMVKETRKWSFTIAALTLFAQLIPLLGGPSQP